jgi:hypothetical protein
MPGESTEQSAILDKREQKSYGWRENLRPEGRLNSKPKNLAGECH